VADATYKVEILVEAVDRLNLLVDVASTLSGMGANVLHATTNSHSDGMVEMRFLLQVSDISSIRRTTDELEKINGVFEARRTLPGEGENKRNKD